MEALEFINQTLTVEAICEEIAKFKDDSFAEALFKIGEVPEDIKQRILEEKRLEKEKSQQRKQGRTGRRGTPGHKRRAGDAEIDDKGPAQKKAKHHDVSDDEDQVDEDQVDEDPVRLNLIRLIKSFSAQGDKRITDSRIDKHKEHFDELLKSEYSIGFLRSFVRRLKFEKAIAAKDVLLDEATLELFKKIKEYKNQSNHASEEFIEFFTKCVPDKKRWQFCDLEKFSEIVYILNSNEVLLKKLCSIDHDQLSVLRSIGFAKEQEITPDLVISHLREYFQIVEGASMAVDDDRDEDLSSDMQIEEGEQAQKQETLEEFLSPFSPDHRAELLNLRGKGQVFLDRMRLEYGDVSSAAAPASDMKEPLSSSRSASASPSPSPSSAHSPAPSGDIEMAMG